MNDNEQHFERLVNGLRNGDARIAQEFWDQYGPLLHKVAEGHLAHGLRRRVGPEDVVQSVCRTFLRRAQGGQFQLADSESLWRLLCAIALTKIREQTRYHMRQRRGLDQEVHGLPTAEESGASVFPLQAPGPTPAEAAAFADQFEQLLASFDEEERQMIDLKLQEFTQEEIAQRLGCSERTVRRVLKRVQQRLERSFTP
jgi:RNA polymerase sigma-70 factor, ECF subfamily